LAARRGKFHRRGIVDTLTRLFAMISFWLRRTADL
jgi:hypothetical protein